LLKYTLANNLGGFECLAGIPATVGGLVVMNASSYGREISACLHEVEVMDGSGNIKNLKKEEIFFSYRKSSLGDYVVLRSWFEIVKDHDVKAKVSNYLKTRMSKQDFEFPSCGCIFKNPVEKPAGFLIEACGLKGFKKNDAQISPKHANFIINLNKARYNDVDYLTSCIKESVHKKFGIVLEEEIKRWS
jgi:UDP-N-acetylmuramate dehydrogenase